MGEKKDFIKEKIVKKTGAGRGFRSFIKILAGAVVFGFVAAGVFALSAPYTEKILGGETGTEIQETVTIPRDEPETLATIVQSVEETETAPEDGELINDVTEEESTEPVEDIVQEVMEEYDYSVSDLSTMWDNVAKLCDGLDRSIVRVRSRSLDRDIFDNELSHEGEYSGIIIADTDAEYMILTRAAAAESDDGLSVELVDEETCEALVRSRDQLTGLAVIGIDKGNIKEETLESITPIELGNSYHVERGDMLLELGSPGGVIHSTAYGWVTYVEQGVSVVDGAESHIYLNSSCCGDQGTWVLNVDGQLVGWTACSENDDETVGAQSENITEADTVIGISEYKSLLERMINAGRYAYIGLRLSEKEDAEETEDAENTVPDGLYVIEVVKGSPAYEAGILAGDTLTELGNVDMRSIGAYTRLLENLSEGTKIEAIVYRDAIDEYKEISYEITVGERE